LRGGGLPRPHPQSRVPTFGAALVEARLDDLRREFPRHGIVVPVVVVIGHDIEDHPVSSSGPQRSLSGGLPCWIGDAMGLEHRGEG
jgi:hypothetical protein